ncbi:MAG: type IV pilus twitching motility protein PilT, partial [Planctomycetota bacterium]
MEFTITDLLHRMVQSDASDLHIKAGSKPGFRIDGKIKLFEEDPKLSPDDTRSLAGQLMSEEQKSTFDVDGDLDFSHAVAGLARFRVNVLTQRGSTGMVIRQIADSIPTIDDLKLPDVCKTLALKPRGLVLVTGPTGSGKSTTLAAMIDYINENEEGHILTMEDPLEFIHPDKKCFVNQRQIGSDCTSFGQALRRALRQDPDVILIGEMRDLETISLAITAAETGHLVFGTLHTTSAISTIDRIIDVFPADQQEQVRVQLSSTLQGVISQCLVSKEGGGRAAAHEILIATDGVRSLVREGKTAQMLNFLQTGSKHGMGTLEQSLVNLVNQGLVSLENAVGKANRPDDVAKNARPAVGRAHGQMAPQGSALGGQSAARASSDSLKEMYSGK